MAGAVGVHAVEGPFDLRFEEGVELLEEWLEMGEVVMQEVGVLVAVVAGELLVHAEGADRPAACIGGGVPRKTTS
jgi:hypothetical protein